MRFTEFLAMFGVGLGSFFVFYCSGVSLFPAIYLGSIFFFAACCMLNYLNHDKFQPFVRRSSDSR